jgi:amino acid adenylation domain-containing protein
MTSVRLEEAAPLSSAQETLQLLAGVPGAERAYHVHACLRLHGPLDVEALETALRDVGSRHPTLAGGEELRRLEASSEGEVREAAAREVVRPFELDGPLWRATLWRLGDDDHVFLWCAHQIACDRPSVPIVLRELAEAYAGRQPEVECSVTWADLVRREQEALARDAEGAAAWWKEHLAGTPDLTLPSDRPRPPRPGFRSEVARLRAEPRLGRALRELARAEGADPLAVSLAALGALLRRSTGHEDVVVGMPYDGRPPGAEDVVGCFGTSIPVRLHVAADSSFRELVAAAGATAAAATEHGMLPLPQIVEALHDDPERSRVPLFRIGLVVEDERPPELPGLRVETERLDAGSAELDLTVTVKLAGDDAELAAEYDVEQYDQWTVERFLHHLHALLRAALAAPERRPAEETLLAPGETVAIVERWTDATEPAAPENVLELFHSQVERTPDAPALEAGDERLTFAELQARATRLAALLRAHGAGRDERVAFCLPRVADLPVAALAVLEAGAGYVPLDATLPPERMRYMLEDSKPVAVLVHSTLADRVPAGDVPVLVLDRLGDELAAQPADAPPADVRADDLAYVIYTSGTTGRPKGIEMTHRAPANVVAYQLRFPRRLPPGEGRTLQFTTLAFDVSVQELFVTWCGGDTVVMIDEESRADPEQLLRVLREQRITTLYLPHVALEQLVHAAELTGEAPPTLVDVYQAGEQLKVTPALRSFFAALPGCVLHNHYGPTETHICTEYTLSGPPEEWPELPPIGRPIDDARAFVLDDARRAVPAGGIGELYVGGVQIARGYLGREELTRERFAEIDVDGGPERAYNSGDLVRLDAHGELQFLGRRDTQVKIRGFRVELGEIETALAEHPAVAMTVVALRTLGVTPALVAYVVPSPSAPDEARLAEELHAHLAERLPPYMLPRRYVTLERFPRTATGKVDRKLLPAPTLDGEGAQAAPPETPWEEVVVSVLERRLDAAGAGREDRFFELGGHSLAALGVVGDVKAECGVRLPVSLLLANASVAEIGAAIEAEVLRGLGPEQLDALLNQVSAGQGGRG